MVIDAVGSSNTLRAEFSPNGPPNIPEFGTVKDEAGFHALYEMDAYQHVKDGVAYPSVLLTTGLNDPRVSSWEPTKMTARLQAATSSKNPIILRVETDAGHGIGSTRAQRDHETGRRVSPSSSGAPATRGSSRSRDDDELGGLAAGEQMLGEGLEAWIASLGGQGGEVEHPPGSGAAAGDEAQTLELAGVAVEGGDADERGGLAAAHGAESGMRTTSVAATMGPTPGREVSSRKRASKVGAGLDGAQDLRRQLGLQPVPAGGSELRTSLTRSFRVRCSREVFSAAASSVVCS